MTTRRQLFVALLGASGLLQPLALLAQRRSTLKRIGILVPRAAPTSLTSLEADSSYGAFLKTLRELGHVEGKNVAFEWRFSEGKYERLAGLAKELVDARVDVIVAPTPPGIQAARRATGTIPIVMVAVGDPVALGFVTSFARPGGNVTGVSNAIDDVSRKYLELLRMALPKLSRVVALVNPDNPNVRNILGQVKAAAQEMGIQLEPVEANTPERLAAAFEAMRQTRPEAVIVQADGFLFSQRMQIADLALRNRAATMFWSREPVQAGGLMSYGQNVADDYRNAANYVHKILMGANPRDLPVEQPTHLKIAINLRTARALGLAIPRELLLRADEVIE